MKILVILSLYNNNRGFNNLENLLTNNNKYIVIPKEGKHSVSTFEGNQGTFLDIFKTSDEFIILAHQDRYEDVLELIKKLKSLQEIFFLVHQQASGAIQSVNQFNDESFTVRTNFNTHSTVVDGDDNHFLGNTVKQINDWLELDSGVSNEEWEACFADNSYSSSNKERILEIYNRVVLEIAKGTTSEEITQGFKTDSLDITNDCSEQIYDCLTNLFDNWDNAQNDIQNFENLVVEFLNRGGD